MTNNTTTKLFLLMSGLFLISALTAICLAFSVRDKGKLTNPEYLKGYTLDLPEEISVASEEDNLGVYITGKSIDLYFKQKTDYQLNVNSDSIQLFDGTRLVGTVSIDGNLNSLILKDNE